MSTPNLRDHRPARASPAVQQVRSSHASSLTRNVPSVIVISCVDEPICPCVDIQPPSPAAERRYHVLPHNTLEYKFQSIAL